MKVPFCMLWGNVVKIHYSDYSKQFEKKQDSKQYTREAEANLTIFLYTLTVFIVIHNGCSINRNGIAES